MGLDDRLEPLGVRPALEPAHGLGELAFVRDVADLLVVGEPMTKLVVERGLIALSDADHAGSDRRERTDKLPLVYRKTGLDEDDVHERGGGR